MIICDICKDRTKETESCAVKITILKDDKDFVLDVCEDCKHYLSAYNIVAGLRQIVNGGK